VICTFLMGAGMRSQPDCTPEASKTDRSYMPWIRKTMVFGLIGAVVSIFGGWGIKQSLFGDNPVPGSGTDPRMDDF
jgi:hypothetical protein